MWKFNYTPHGFWKVPSNQRNFMNTVAKTLNITSSEGWYAITYHKLLDHGAHTLLKRYNNSPSKLLAAVYPEYPNLPIVLHLILDINGKSTNFIKRRMEQGQNKTIFNHLKFSQNLQENFELFNQRRKTLPSI